jgi:Tfp pilus assembly protein PilW
MKVRKKKGFTLIEILIATVTVMIVILAAGMSLVVAHRLLGKAWKMVNLQRDASFAMFVLEQQAKEGTRVTVQSGGTAATIYDINNSWVSFSFMSVTNELQRQFEGKPPHTMIGNVENLLFTVQENRLEIYMELKKDDLITHLASTVMMRNYGLL